MFELLVPPEAAELEEVRGDKKAYDREMHADMYRFVTLLIARRLLRTLKPERQRESLSQLLQKAKKAWHGVKLNRPDWSQSSHSVAITAELRTDEFLVHFIMNAYWEPLDFELPPPDQEYGPLWRRWIDTSQDSPNDIEQWQRRRRFHALAIARRRDRWSCCLPALHPERILLNNGTVANMSSARPSPRAFRVSVASTSAISIPKPRPRIRSIPY